MLTFATPAVGALVALALFIESLCESSSSSSKWKEAWEVAVVAMQVGTVRLIGEIDAALKAGIHLMQLTQAGKNPTRVRSCHKLVPHKLRDDAC